MAEAAAQVRLGPRFRWPLGESEERMRKALAVAQGLASCVQLTTPKCNRF